uniref:Nucleolar protein 11 N-terminal domain-containing protein n=1 Tax=Ciona savignyi TaxID=51511 RepID=H2ZG40_CIOSA
MASFGEQKLLLKSDRKLIGIRPGRNVEEVILTYDNGITICDIDHKKVKRSLSIGKGQQFTASCIYNNRDDEYVVVQEGIVIRTFNEQSFNNGQRFTVNVPIYEITADCDNHDSAVVFNNGNVLTLEAVLENPSGIPSTDPLVGNILFCKLLTNLTSVMCIQEDNNSFLVFGNGYQNNEKSKIQFQYRACELRSVCVHCSSPQVIKVFSLWSDGSVCETSISFPDNVGLPVEFVNIKEFQNKSISGNNMVSLSSDCIALVAQESGDYREVSVIDTKFGMCHHTISSLPLSTKIYTTGHNLY